ncbi:hypothetical protein L2E82_27524 [Cichorium intybus]|uniref:Uncharacterized protein n=1 Tax=Cichorium intybus TaxID=13427 RepID=A0ACB9CTB9_CICIN|nr:hypothetical protein L2E82_27524 [Cichorium intybus]
MSSTEATWLSGDSPPKRQKNTGKEKQIEKKSSQFWEPRTTPSEHAQDQKKQPPPPPAPPLPTEPEWIPGYTLSQHPAEIRQALFMKKKPSICIEKKVNMEEFEDYDVMDPIYKMGWGGILELESDICYDQAVIEWMSTLQCHGEGVTLTLTGMVRGRQYTLTHYKIKRMFGVDTGIRGEPGRVYEYPDESYLQPSNLETQNWIDRLQELFFLPSEIHTVKYTSLGIADLKPQAKVLWRVGVWNIFPRDGYQKEVLVRDISILYGLISGRVAISYAHLVMLNLWATYNKIEYRSSIPHGYLLSRFLDNEGAITSDMEPRWIKIQNRILTQEDIPHLEFSFEPPFHIVDWENRTFMADFEPEEREIVEREKAERVRKREEQRNRVQEQVSEYPNRSPKTERGGSRSPSGEESETLNLKKSEKVWSPESCTSCVQGYKVKNSIAPILEAIFMKYGDIAAGCQFKTGSLKAGFLELVCEVVMQLQTNDDATIISKMGEIESKVSDAETANINVSWLRSHLEDRKMSSLIMETKLKTSMLKKAAEMKVRKRGAELMAAQQRFEKAERCLKVLELVERKLDNNIHHGHTPCLL